MGADRQHSFAPSVEEAHKGFASALASIGLVCLTAAILLAPALWNRQPLLYPDSVDYVHNGEQAIRYVFGTTPVRSWKRDDAATARGAGAPIERGGPVSLSRSVYYGLIAYAGYAAGGLWLTVLVQALAVGWLLHLLVVRVWRLEWADLLIASAGLVCLTPLGVYTVFVMPDVFAPTSILAVSILAAYWSRLSPPERAGLVALLLVGLLTHSSHVAITIVLLPVVAWVAYAARWRHLRQLIVALVVCVVAAFVADWGFKRAAESATDRPSVRLPHLTARLVGLGPGTRYLQKHCPDAGYAACRYVRNYPTHWNDFLFSRDPRKGAWFLSDNEQKRRMSNEQSALALAVLRAEPAAVAGGLALDVLRQATSFAVDIWPYGPSHPAIFQFRLPPEIRQIYNTTRVVRSPSLNPWLTGATYATTGLALALLLWRRRARGGITKAADDGVSAQDWYFAGLVVSGVLANAIVCGALASPFDRFQARVIWLLPLLAIGIARRKLDRPTPSVQS